MRNDTNPPCTYSHPPFALPKSPPATTGYWNCCQCGSQTLHDLLWHMTCPECAHGRCMNCAIELSGCDEGV
ncbi:hypothetical protein GQ43DRAFT_444056 [Delitschia confertaspora ATCC 74209]|uniref:Uncharacterized protein n=1 Tax=Delitschia confertaspora ATCC 74209 TaxID=1513339 RepID=A0A9P4JDY3_9PLEO|nr:hypothetical protein GQ43DRAFT_444056 [Delitschia confertaspora ATCC 74209]